MCAGSNHYEWRKTKNSLFCRSIFFFVKSIYRNFLSKKFTKLISSTFCDRICASQCGKRKIYSHWKNILSNHLFSIFFSKNVAFTKFLPKMLRERKFQKLPHCDIYAENGDGKFFQCPHCGTERINWRIFKNLPVVENPSKYLTHYLQVGHKAWFYHKFRRNWKGRRRTRHFDQTWTLLWLAH